MIAALFVEAGGGYCDLPDVQVWDEARDARKYAGPYPIVAHPPCQRWGRFWHGSTRKPHQFQLGDDGGCFASALRSLVAFGGVLEHPAHSRAWEAFNLPTPDRRGGWRMFGDLAACHVEQGHYGHLARKATWLLACRAELPNLIWGAGEQRLHPRAVELHGYEKARRIGVMAMVGGKDKTRIRNTTPPAFRDILIAMARTAEREVAA